MGNNNENWGKVDNWQSGSMTCTKQLDIQQKKEGTNVSYRNTISQEQDHNSVKHYTYLYLSYEQISLFLSHSKISGHGEVKHRVIIVDISDNYVHSSSGCLKKKK